MTDPELLERAANATGHPWKWVEKCPRYGDLELPGMLLHDGVNSVDYYPAWNPLANDGDAFRLAVKLCLYVRYHEALGQGLVTTIGGDEFQVNVETCGGDPAAATRRAIVCAAADSSRQVAHSSQAQSDDGSPSSYRARPSDPDLNPDISASASPATKEQQ